MSNQQPIASYTNLAHRVILYADRVELGVFSLTSYSLEEIQTAKFTNLFIATTFRLKLKDGTRSETIQMFNAKARECQEKLEALLLKQRTAPTGLIESSLRCTYIGGTGTALSRGQACLFLLGKHEIVLVEGSHRASVPFTQLTDITIEGPGTVTTRDALHKPSATLLARAWVRGEDWVHEAS